MAVCSCAHERAPGFRVGQLASQWKPFRISGIKFAYHHSDGGSIVAAIDCNLADQDASLHVLTNHLLFEFDKIEQEKRLELTLDGRAALRTQMVARLDGVPVALDIVVTKRDGCTNDFQLVAPIEKIAARRPDFERFLAGYARE